MGESKRAKVVQAHRDVDTSMDPNASSSSAGPSAPIVIDQPMVGIPAPGTPDMNYQTDNDGHIIGPRTDMDVQAVRLVSHVDIAEIYSMPRITTTASQRGLNAGWSMDVRNGWDFNDPKQRARAIDTLETTKPLLLVGSPPCTMFSTIMRLWNIKKMAPEVLKARMKEAILHVTFAVKLYRIQMASGRLFIHEDLDQASS